MKLKQYFKIYLVLLYFLLVPILSVFAQDKLEVKYFYSSHCKVCFKLKHRFFPKILEKYQDQIIWEELETSSNEDNLLALISISGRFKQQASTPAIYFDNTLLIGKKDIKAKLENSLDSALKIGTKGLTLPIFFNKDQLVNMFKKLSLLTVIGSGLIDGINPCAFAVIVFFVSFLAVYGYRKREIIWVGISYCLAVFLTYFFVGLGFFKFLYALKGIYFFINGFYYFIAGFCFCLAGLSIYDYIRFKKTKQADEMILQLPKFLKKQINFVIGSHMRDREENNIISTIINAFIVGVLVSLLEAVCTGQVYLPTIAFILKNTQYKLKAAVYLFIYNLMFITPLIIIFVLAVLGFSSSKFTQFLKANLGRIKIFLAIFFFVLGFLTLLFK